MLRVFESQKKFAESFRESCVMKASEGVGKVWCKLATSFSWCSMLGKGDVRDKQLYIYSYFDHFVTAGTVDAVFDILRWSFTALAEGKWPRRDWQNKPLRGDKGGTPLAGGYRGVLFGLLGDLEFQASVLQLPRWSAKRNLCSLCRCTRDGDLSWLPGDISQVLPKTLLIEPRPCTLKPKP